MFEECNKDLDYDYKITVSFIEIYNETNTFQSESRSCDSTVHVLMVPHRRRYLAR